jgi:hypothetical protein
MLSISSLVRIHRVKRPKAHKYSLLVSWKTLNRRTYGDIQIIHKIRKRGNPAMPTRAWIVSMAKPAATIVTQFKAHKAGKPPAYQPRLHMPCRRKTHLDLNKIALGLAKSPLHRWTIMPTRQWKQTGDKERERTKKKYAAMGSMIRRVTILENFNFECRPDFILPCAWNNVQ